MATRTALVVDDSRSARFALRKFLQSRDFAVDTAESAEEAYRYLQGRRPSVVFLDHVMPGIDGLQALDEIRAHPDTRDLPVVICSSNDGEDFAREARRRGAIGVLCKPPSAARLSQIIAELETAAPGAGVSVETDALETRAAPEGEDQATAPASHLPPVNTDDGVASATHRIESALLGAVRRAVSERAPRADAGSPERLDALQQRLDRLASGVESRLAAIEARLQALSRALDQRPSADAVRETAREECDALRLSLKDELNSLRRAIEARPETPPVDADTLATLRTELAELRKAGGASRAELIQAARSAASVEASDVATRTVLQMSSKIADRLAESIVAALADKRG